MIELLLICLLSAGLTSLSLWAYRRGLKDGLALKNDKPIAPIKTPVAIVQEAKQAKEAKAETDKLMQTVRNLFSYDGSPQKEESDND